MELDLNGLPNDAVHVCVSQFGGDDIGVLEMETMTRTVGKLLAEYKMSPQRGQKS
jgi:hypothetical protein